MLSLLLKQGMNSGFWTVVSQNSFVKKLKQSSRFLCFLWVIFLLFGIFTYQEFEPKMSWELVDAEVIDVVEHVSRDDDGTNSFTYTPTFRFEYHGQVMEKSTQGSSSAYHYRVGSTRQIYYSEKTDRISANSSSDQFLLLPPFIGLILLICWIMGLIKKKKEE